MGKVTIDEFRLGCHRQEKEYVGNAKWQKNDGSVGGVIRKDHILKYR
jgi:hypothetical protein